jgi:Undecaprenyl-phosphate glucose phosphotransferase
LFFGHPLALGSSVMVGTVVGLLFTGLSQMRDGYRFESLTDIPLQVRSICVNWLAAWVFLAFTAFAVKSNGDFSRISTVVMMVVTPGAIFAARRSINRWFSRAVSEGLVAHDRLAILQIGSGVDIPAKILSEFAIVHSQVLPVSVVTSFQADLEAFVRDTVNSRARKVLVQVPLANLSVIDELSEHLRRLPIPSMIVTDEWLMRAFQRPTALHGELAAFELQAPPLTLLQRAQKRAIDTVASSLGLFFLSPVLAVVAIAVKLDTPGPIFFRQRRLGFNGKEFRIFKFRSMRVIEDGGAVRQAARNDHRITRIGRFIRASSLDELPQLLNVLRGEMSLVGPRPHAIAHDNHFDSLIGDYSLRRHMKPGLTGWAQVNGHRGETPTTAHMSARVEHDLWYIANWSIWLDLWILMRTAKELVTNRDVF